jgi:hypothetical protein
VVVVVVQEPSKPIVISSPASLTIYITSRYIPQHSTTTSQSTYRRSLLPPSVVECNSQLQGNHLLLLLFFVCLFFSLFRLSCVCKCSHRVIISSREEIGLLGSTQRLRHRLMSTIPPPHTHTQPDQISHKVSSSQTHVRFLAVSFCPSFSVGGWEVVHRRHFYEWLKGKAIPHDHLHHTHGKREKKHTHPSRVWDVIYDGNNQ